MGDNNEKLYTQADMDYAEARGEARGEARVFRAIERAVMERWKHVPWLRENIKSMISAALDFEPNPEFHFDIDEIDAYLDSEAYPETKREHNKQIADYVTHLLIPKDVQSWLDEIEMYYKNYVHCHNLPTIKTQV